LPDVSSGQTGPVFVYVKSTIKLSLPPTVAKARIVVVETSDSGPVYCELDVVGADPSSV
jgi:hypothetical protein